MGRNKLKATKEPENDLNSLQDSTEQIINEFEQLADRQTLLFDLTKQADDLAEIERKKREREKLKFELLNGSSTSIYEEKQKIEKLLSELPINYDPKFSDFFPALGSLMGWSEEETKNYKKPPIAAATINEVIYSRFSSEVLVHIHKKNPYISWCIRKYKNYRFLGEDGIIQLEQFIYDAVVLLKQSSSYYEFRQRHAEKFGTAFQFQLFDA